jgi:hypothetical protein
MQDNDLESNRKRPNKSNTNFAWCIVSFNYSPSISERVAINFRSITRISLDEPSFLEEKASAKEELDSKF